MSGRRINLVSVMPSCLEVGILRFYNFITLKIKYLLLFICSLYFNMLPFYYSLFSLSPHIYNPVPGLPCMIVQVAFPAHMLPRTT